MAIIEKGRKYSELRIILFGVIMVFFSNAPLLAQYNKDVIKAAYIERITRFVDWPSKDSQVAGDQFVIGVYDEDEFFYALKEVFKEKTIKELRVKVISVKTPKQISACNICYISESARPHLNEFIDNANASSVLLISETTGFCQTGVHINFYVEEEKLKFELNEVSMASAGFKVSYLLKQNIRIIR